MHLIHTRDCGCHYCRLFYSQFFLKSFLRCQSYASSKIKGKFDAKYGILAIERLLPDSNKCILSHCRDIVFRTVCLFNQIHSRHSIHWYAQPLANLLQSLSERWICYFDTKWWRGTSKYPGVFFSLENGLLLDPDLDQSAMVFYLNCPPMIVSVVHQSDHWLVGWDYK